MPVRPRARAHDRRCGQAETEADHTAHRGPGRCAGAGGLRAGRYRTIAPDRELGMLPRGIAEERGYLIALEASPNELCHGCVRISLLLESTGDDVGHSCLLRSPLLLVVPQRPCQFRVLFVQ